MARKRTDNKGRILKAGEYQRSNGSYEYRYKFGNTRQSIYGRTLSELRELEKDLEHDLWDGIDPNGGNITVFEYVQKYIKTKRNFKNNTLRNYNSVIRQIGKSDFGKLKIKDVKLSTAKLFYLDLHDKGLKRNTIACYHNVLHPAFEMAVDDDLIRKNPFKFELSNLLKDDTNKRNALTADEEALFLNYLQEYGNINYYQEIVILLGTGLRVSELYGLTLSDIDMKNKVIHVTHQLCRTSDKPYFITDTKTKCGVRSIPMSDKVYNAFVYIINNRKTPQIEMFVDGYTGFLFLDTFGNPKVAMNLEGFIRSVRNKYLKTYNTELPPITPHVLRHTFCTKMQKAGMDVKSLQYLMGHSDVNVTLNVYAHSDFESASEAFKKVSSNC